MKCQMTWNVKWYEMPNYMKRQMTWNAKLYEMPKDADADVDADADARSMTPSRNTRSHTSERTIVPWTVIFLISSSAWRVFDLALSCPHSRDQEELVVEWGRWGGSWLGWRMACLLTALKLVTLKLSSYTTKDFILRSQERGPEEFLN